MHLCRLCSGPLTKQFNLLVLNKHDVAYYRCDKCGSLQTEQPFWLAEAYETSLTKSDVGAVGRCLTCRAAIWVLLRLLRMREVRLLDFGGGSGLLCRLLRDIGIDAWTYDSYGTSEYALSFKTEKEQLVPGSFNMVSSFELLEHLPEPGKDLEAIFRLAPETFFASTEPYSPAYQQDWWYLSPSTGQHVFFYSPQALQMIAARFGYSLVSVGGWHLFTRQPLGRNLSRMVRRSLSSRVLLCSRIVIEALPTWRHIQRDHALSLGGGRINDTE